MIGVVFVVIRKGRVLEMPDLTQINRKVRHDFECFETSLYLIAAIR